MRCAKGAYFLWIEGNLSSRPVLQVWYRVYAQQLPQTLPATPRGAGASVINRVRCGSWKGLKAS